MSSFRRPDAFDADAYTGVLVQMLINFPEWVVRKALDPMTGLPAKQSWMPTAFEVLQACKDVQAAAASHERKATAPDYEPVKRDPEEKARVMEGFRRLRESLSGVGRTAEHISERDAREMKAGVERDRVIQYNLDKLEASKLLPPCQLSERAVAAIRERDRIRLAEGV
jgi:hypothetical protein